MSWRSCLCLAVVACGSQPPAAPGGGSIRIPVINDPIFNPVVAPDLGSVMVNKVLFPGLVRPDSTLAPSPDLALSWTTSDDGRTYTFALRPGVRWHDGASFTARDVKFTFDQVLDLSSGTRLRSDFAAITEVEVVDSLTVRFHLSAPFAPFLTLLGYNAGILPEHLLRGQRLADAVAFNRSTPVGTGPYRVSRVSPGARVELVPNPYWYGDPPGAQRLAFVVVPDINVQVAQLRAGELDLITIEPTHVAGLQAVRDVTISQVPVAQHWYVAFNAESSLFAPASVRRALGYAVNRQAIINGVLKGYGDLPHGTIPVALAPWFDSTLVPVPYAPDSARRLLAMAGWAPGPDGVLRDKAGRRFAFELLVDKGNPTREQAALAVQQDLGAIGVAVTIRTMEFAALVRDHVVPRRFAANLIWWTTPPDPDQFAFYATGQDNNNVRWSNRVADSLLALGRATVEPATRRAAYHAFQRVERDDPPVLVLFYPREIRAAASRLRGLLPIGVRDALRHSERLTLAR